MLVIWHDLSGTRPYYTCACGRLATLCLWIDNQRSLPGGYMSLRWSLTVLGIVAAINMPLLAELARPAGGYPDPPFAALHRRVGDCQSPLDLEPPCGLKSALQSGWAMLLPNSGTDKISTPLTPTRHSSFVIRHSSFVIPLLQCTFGSIYLFPPSM